MAEAASCLRVQDPFVRFHNRWLVRRMAPDCSRIELASLAAERDEARLLYSMGWETANMHFGSPQAIPQIKRELAKRKKPLAASSSQRDVQCYTGKLVRLAQGLEEADEVNSLVGSLAIVDGLALRRISIS